jgi:hypothetical protein
MKILRQSTAATPGIGPFVDTTGAAATGLTLAQTDIIISKGGSTTYAAKNDATSATHRSGGVYTVPLDATDTGTVGPLTIVVNKSGALPYSEKFFVCPANVYDTFTGADRLAVDALEINSNTTAASNLAISASEMVTGTVDNTAVTATTTVLETSSITTAAADHWKGRVIIFTSGTLQYQATAITAYALNGGRGHFTYNAVTSAPASGVSFIII